MREFLGYYEYKVAVTSGILLMQACLDYGIEMYHIRECGETLSFRLPLGEKKRAESIFVNKGILFQRGDMRGVAGGVCRVARHPGIICGIVLSLLLWFWLSGMIWEVRIVSPADMDEDQVRSVLANCGLYEGARVSSVNADEVVANYLLADRDAAFATVHLSGVVAEVEIIPQENREEPEKTGTPCNIVATKDALITDITVYAGRALVKPGETVTKGDVLVSGVVTDVTGTRLVAARADVRGEHRETIMIEVPETVTCTHVTRIKKSGLTIEVLGRKMTIGNIPAESISESKQIYLFSKIRLPIRFMLHTAVATESEERMLTENMQQARAEAMLKKEQAALIGDGTLIAMTEKTETQNGIYRLTSEIVFEENIGKALAIDTENH